MHIYYLMVLEVGTLKWVGWQGYAASGGSSRESVCLFQLLEAACLSGL